MSAEPTTLGLDGRRGARPAEETLAEVDLLIESTLADLRSALAEAAATGGGPSAVHDPGPLGVDLVGELAGRVRNHGKRLRPVLAHWGWQVAGGDRSTSSDAVRVAAALELLHLFALVQDDVMDRSETRRGWAALHAAAASRHHDVGGHGDARLFGDSVATLVADLALSEAGALVSPTASEVRRVWRLMTVELVEGQLLDVTHTAGRRRDLATSLRIARFKSGRYTVTRPLHLGALVAGCEPDRVARLVTWGDLVGDAFAVRDDVLGVWGDPAHTGKPAGDDLRSGKPTVLLCWADELLPRAARPLLDACDAGTLDVNGVAQLRVAMAECGVLDRAEAEIAGLVDRSRTALDDIDAHPEAIAALSSLADTIAWRVS
ncbi:MAG: polyprenyl synthetase family protein [Dermatophilaceae bacterium]